MYTDNRCALLNLQATLKSVQIVLDGEDETCRRASSAQQHLLMDFMDNIQAQYEVVAPPVSEILRMIRVSALIIPHINYLSLSLSLSLSPSCSLLIYSCQGCFVTIEVHCWIFRKPFRGHLSSYQTVNGMKALVHYKLFFLLVNKFTDKVIR